MNTTCNKDSCDLINQINQGSTKESWFCRTHHRPYYPNQIAPSQQELHSKPTDSEQLPTTLWLQIRTTILTNEDTRRATDEITQLIAQRDQQRLSAVLEAIASKMRSTNCVYVNGVNDCLEALTEALGPDNSSMEEKK